MHATCESNMKRDIKVTQSRLPRSDSMIETHLNSKNENDDTLGRLQACYWMFLANGKLLVRKLSPSMTDSVKSLRAAK